MVAISAVELLAVDEAYVVLYNFEVPRAIPILLPTRKKALENGFEGAFLLLVDAVEHPQHYMARLQEDKIRQSQSPKDKGPALVPFLEPLTDFSYVARIVDALFIESKFLLGDLLITPFFTALGHFEKLSHYVGLFGEH